jgi:hypothetical protein
MNHWIQPTAYKFMNSERFVKGLIDSGYNSYAIINEFSLSLLNSCVSNLLSPRK